MLKILFLAAGIAMIASCRLAYLSAKKRKNDDLCAYSTPVRRFSVSEYMERTEKAWLEIMREQERKPVYLITIWWGLDGLKLNEDGTTEWIRRGANKPDNLYYGLVQSITPPPAPSYSCGGVENVAMSVDAQIRALQSQMQANIIQQSSMIQTAALISAIRPSYSQYPTQCGYYPQQYGYWGNPYWNWK